MEWDVEKRDEESIPEVLIREGKQLVKTQTPFQTAIVVQKARDIVTIRGQLMKESDMAGEAFYYSWPVKTKGGGREIVEGPSIQLAVSAARLFGNCVWSADYAEDEERYYLNGHFVDLETGFNVSRPFRQRKAPEIGDYQEDRKQDIAFQIGVSKAMRNVIVRGGLPPWLIEQAMNRAKHSNVKRFEQLWRNKKTREEVIKKALAEFEKLEVNGLQIEGLMGPQKSWTPQIMAELYGMAQAIKDGQSTVSEIFGGETGGTEIDKQFWDRINETPKIENGDVSEYLKTYSQTMGISQVVVMKDALGEWDAFMESFNTWREKARETPKKRARRKKPEKAPEGTKGKEEKSPPGGNMEAGTGEAPQEPGGEGPKGFDLLIKKMVAKIATVNTEGIAKSLLPKDLTPDQANQLMGFLREIPEREKIDVARWIDELKSIGAWKK